MQLPAQIQDALALVARGQAPEAVSRLVALSDRNDGPASFQLAEWHREGSHVPQSFSAAREYYRRAGSVGLIEGLRRYLALRASGVGGPREWPQSIELMEAMAPIDPQTAGELALVRAMTLKPNGDPQTLPAAEVVSETPRIFRISELLTDAECAYLIDAAGPLFEPARTYNEQTGQDFLNAIRTSDTAAFPWIAENPAIHAINRRIAAVSGTDVSQGEPLQILRYGQGQEYKPHIDAIPGLENQRIMTMLIYLNDDFDGGETVFTQAGVRVSARRGDAILFGNVVRDGRPDPAMVHAGLPVTSGTKYLASRWIRERPTSA